MKHLAPSLPKRRAVRLGLVLTPVLAVAVGTSVIWQTSYAAFSATTDNGVNNWQAGSVTLTDNDNAAVMFNVTGLKPGSTGTSCITVTASGLPSEIRLYGTSTTASTTANNALASALQLTVTRGTGGTYGNCTGFAADGAAGNVYSGNLADFRANRGSYATGATGWTTTSTASSSRTFQFSYTLDPNATNTSQNGSASMTFTWESQNT
ncbi:hypothetical protein [Modestobacter sp. SSW1-42]|uniref:hypothetical protein n=1 Tax=Modestobacter sp. SSW1-42 TaxID=596372 RepID=UPI0039864F12